MTSLSQGRTAAVQCGLFTHKSVPVIFEPPCTFIRFSFDDRSIASYKREGHHIKWEKSHVLFTECTQCDVNQVGLSCYYDGNMKRTVVEVLLTFVNWLIYLYCVWSLGCDISL